MGVEGFLILMDIQMPRLDGHAATEELHRQGIKTPIIAVSAAEMEENRQRAREAGCDDFLVKPIDTRRLLETVQQWTNQPQ